MGTGLEPLVALLGSSVVRQAVTVWLGRRARPGETTRELVETQVAGPLESRRVLRQLSGIEDAVFTRLAVDADDAPVPDAEREAVVRAVVDAFEDAGLDEDDLRDVQFDPAAVAALVQRRAHRAPDHLSPAARSMHRSMIDATAAVFVTVVSTAPRGEGRSLFHLLRRDGRLEETLRDLLTGLPARPRDNPDDAERLYRSYLAESLDRVELAGFPAVERAGRGRLTATFTRPDVRLRSTPVPLDWALADNPRLFLHGPAGSGKTSILKWLAVVAAREQADGLLGSFSGLLPLYVTVRRLFTGDAPPDPSASLADLAFSPSSAQLIADRLGERAEAGTLLVLIDGLDETHPAHRGLTLRWLEDLVERHPGCRYVVTSRSAIPEELLPARFISARVLPLDREGIMRLTRQWLGALADEETPGAATVHARRLVAFIEGDSRLGELASSPLMCSLTCALYRERGLSALRGPDIHEAFVEMFASRRDRERAIGDSGRWSYRATLELLKALAAEMMFRGGDELARPEALDVLGRQPAAGDEAADAYDYLLARSGLLTEPVPGRVSFVHRTFREYLCAREILDHHLFDRAVGNAHDPAWREVLTTVAVLADHREADRLVTLLLRRYSDEPVRRPVIGPLAQGCLASVHWLSPDIRREADEVWREIPPITETSGVLTVETDRPADGKALARWLRAEPAARFAEPVSVTGGQEDPGGYRFRVVGRAGLRHADVVQAVVDWARAQPAAYQRRVVVRDEAGTEIVVRPGSALEG
jgi:energy-coupling factor transporter ATP-binding protein EcfA2